MTKPIIPDAALTQHAIALGKTGSGKSSTLRLLVERLLEHEKPVAILDPKGDWWGLKSSADGKRAGYPVVIFGGEHADVPLNARAGAHVAELVATGNRPCIIDLGGWMVSDRTRFFIDFASTLFRHTRGPRHLVIDEVHNFAPQGKVLDPDAGKMLHWANRLASEGRGKGVTLLAASQRPQKVHKDFVTSCETLIAMRVIHPLDRGAIKEWIDGCPDPAKGKEVLGTLATMQRGEGWVWSPEIGFGPERIAFPKFKTYDSFAAPTGEAVAKLSGWAAVDLDDVKARLAAVVEEAEANDPRLLRAENARLKRELAAKPAAEKPAAAVEKIVEVPVLKDAQLARAEKLVERLQEHGDKVLAEAAELRRLIAPAAAPRPAPRPAVRAPLPAARAPVARPAPSGEASGLASAQRKLLNALAFLEQVGITTPDKTQVSLFAGLSPTAGHTQNMYGGLRSSGLIEYTTPGSVVLTDSGRALADPGTVPQTAEDMHALLLAKVAAAQRKLLTVLIENYPDPMDKRDCSESAGLSPDAGHTQNMYGGLRSLGLIDYPAPGKVVALPVLFLNA